MGLQEIIQERINERLTIVANLLEGGFSQDIIGSVAYELANIQEVQLPDILNNGFVTTADREHLILKGIEYGLPIREATASSVLLKIEGLEGATVSSEVKAVYNNITYTVDDFAKIDETGVVFVNATCDIKGSVGNVAEETITQFLTPYEGLTSVTNLEPSYGGFDDEETETYRNRLLEYIRLDASNANKDQYKVWAMSVAGVSKAIIKGAEELGIQGTVGVYISAIGGTVTDDLKAQVKAYIEEVQPINATVQVFSLTPKVINVTANVVLSPNADLEEVRAEFMKELQQYFNTVIDSVSYYKVADILINISGVQDVTNYKLNNGTSSIAISNTESAEVGNVVING